MRTSSSPSSARYYKCARQRETWFSLQYLNRTEGEEEDSEGEMDDKKKRKKDENAKSDDKVTLKKEIGLLSACAIIIGECARQLRQMSRQVVEGIQLGGGSKRRNVFEEPAHCYDTASRSLSRPKVTRSGIFRLKFISFPQTWTQNPSTKINK